MTLKLVSAPESTPVSLEEAKLQLREIDDDQDELIQIFLNAAVATAEKFMGRALIDQTWDYFLDEFPESDEAIEIPLPPLIEVVGVFYIDSAGDEQEFGAESYIVTGEGGRSNRRAEISLTSPGTWPSPRESANAVRIRFRAGYLKPDSPAEADVEPDIKAAILMHLASLYDNRSTVVIGAVANLLPWGAEQLLRLRRVDLSLA